MCLQFGAPGMSAVSLVLMLERRPPVFILIMDNILRELESLSHYELVWLNTYLTGRLRTPAACKCATHFAP